MNFMKAVDNLMAEGIELDEFIQLDLIDDSIRPLSISNDEVAITSVLNFFNHVVRIDKREALAYDQKKNAYWDAY